MVTSIYFIKMLPAVKSSCFIFLIILKNGYRIMLYHNLSVIMLKMLLQKYYSKSKLKFMKTLIRFK